MIANILSLDLGMSSLGLSISRSGMFITPLPNLKFKEGDFDTCLKMLKETVQFEKVEHIVIGLPSYPSGDPAEMTAVVEAFIPRLQELFPNVDITKVDERESTLEASAILHEHNISSKKQKAIIDSAAAMVILERYLRSIGQY